MNKEQRREKVKLHFDETKTLAQIGREVGASPPTVREDLIALGLYDRYRVRKVRTDPEKERMLWDIALFRRAIG